MNVPLKTICKIRQLFPNHIFKNIKFTIALIMKKYFLDNIITNIYLLFCILYHKVGLSVLKLKKSTTLP